jgi:hypothetical protein
VIFIESPVFTRQVTELLSDDSYAEFQHFLALQPDAGDVIQAQADCARFGGQPRGRASAEEYE